MADPNPKRPREESIDSINESPEGNTKRQKSYNDILSFLDEEEDEPNQDFLSDIFTSFEQEICSQDSVTGPGERFQSLASPAPETERVNGDEESEGLSMMRHLLEASDDELGIPNRVESGDEGGDGGGDGGGEQLGDLVNGLWEFEDEAANYYAVLQSELFL